MENFKKILRVFYQSKSELVEEYYKSVFSYLKDLYSYKNIDLNIRVNDLPKKEKNEISKTILKITRIGLNALGISKKELFELENMNNFILNVDNAKDFRYDDFLF
jgi:CRISPR/Cas system-associated protein Cas5 (RAMP superfamily)